MNSDVQAGAAAVGRQVDPIVQRQLAFAHGAISVALDGAASLSWTSEPQQVAVALHATTIELFAGIVALADVERTAGIPILIRSLYEAIVDLDNLLQSSAYLDYMEFENLRTVQELLAQGRVNPLFRGVRPEADLVAELKETGARLAELEQMGIRRRSVQDRCDKVGRGHEYRTAYALFTLDVHNNIAALAERHSDDPMEILQVNVFAAPPPRVLRARLGLATYYFVTGMVMIHAAFKTGALGPPALLEELRKKSEWLGDIGVGAEPNT